MDLNALDCFFFLVSIIHLTQIEICASTKRTTPFFSVDQLFDIVFSEEPNSWELFEKALAKKKTSFEKIKGATDREIKAIIVECGITGAIVTAEIFTEFQIRKGTSKESCRICNSKI